LARKGQAASPSLDRAASRRAGSGSRGETLITDDDLDSAEEAARAQSGLDEESVLYLLEHLRLLVRRERLRLALMDNVEKVERFLERDEAAEVLTLAAADAPLSLRKVRHYAGNGLWRYALHDPSRLEKGKPIDPPLWVSRLTFR
jgi:hypothetical protein